MVAVSDMLNWLRFWPSKSSLFYAVVRCEIQLFQPSSMSRLKSFWLQLFQNNFQGLLQLMNSFQHVQCC